MTILVTGAAGFIGFHTAKRFCEAGLDVVGIDNLNDYYDVELKHGRLAELENLPNFRFQRLDLADKAGLLELFGTHGFTEVIHLAAQAGVRYSLDNPDAYAASNLVGFLNILEACRQVKPRHLIYASSSSVYGLNSKMPFAVEDAADHPASFYAATKRANELMAHSYSHLYGIEASGLRFFTVYGPWGRPDMAPFKFTRAILNKQPIDVYNDGQMSRDFTYIDDIVEGIFRLRQKPPSCRNDLPPGAAPNKVYNIGRGMPVKLLDFIECIEKALDIKAERNFLPMQPGDVAKTWADVEALAQWVDFYPQVSVDDGVRQFVDWYRSFYRV